MATVILNNASEVFKTIALSLLIFLTFISNGLVLLILVIKERRLLKKPLYVFICNICVADIIACLFTMTFEVSEELTHKWFYGEVLCKIISYLEMSLFGVNIFTHLSIAIDRYVSVVHPLKPPIKLRTTKKLVIFSWCFPFLVALPYIYMRRVVNDHNGYEVCMAVTTELLWLEKLFHSTELVMVFLLPLVAITWIYAVIINCLYRRGFQTDIAGSAIRSNSTRRAASHGSKLSIAVVCVFIVCWVPSITVFIHRLLTTTETIARTDVFFVVALYCSFASELISPVLYCGFDKNIRPALMRFFRCVIGSNRLAEDTSFQRHETSRNDTNANTDVNAMNATPRLQTTTNK